MKKKLLLQTYLQIPITFSEKKVITSDLSTDTYYFQWKKSYYFRLIYRYLLLLVKKKLLLQIYLQIPITFSEKKVITSDLSTDTYYFQWKKSYYFRLIYRYLLFSVKKKLLLQTYLQIPITFSEKKLLLQTYLQIPITFSEKKLLLQTYLQIPITFSEKKVITSDLSTDTYYFQWKKSYYFRLIYRYLLLSVKKKLLLQTYLQIPITFSEKKVITSDLSTDTYYFQCNKTIFIEYYINTFQIW